jgi:hypothetical protein
MMMDWRDDRGMIVGATCLLEMDGTGVNFYDALHFAHDLFLFLGLCSNPSSSD